VLVDKSNIPNLSWRNVVNLLELCSPSVGFEKWFMIPRAASTETCSIQLLLLLKPDLRSGPSEKRWFISSWAFTAYPTIEASICIGFEKDIL